MMDKASASEPLAIPPVPHHSRWDFTECTPMHDSSFFATGFWGDVAKLPTEYAGIPGDGMQILARKKQRIKISTIMTPDWRKFVWTANVTRFFWWGSSVLPRKKHLIVEVQVCQGKCEKSFVFFFFVKEMIKVSGSEKPNIAAAEVLVRDRLIHRMECFCICCVLY